MSYQITPKQFQLDQPARNSSPPSPEIATTPIIIARVSAYSRDLAIWTAEAMDRNCKEFMHLPIVPDDPDSISASRLRDSVIHGGEEVTYAWPKPKEEEPDKKVDSTRVSVDTSAASNEAGFLRLTDDSFQPKADLPGTAVPDLWEQDGFKFLRLN